MKNSEVTHRRLIHIKNEQLESNHMDDEAMMENQKKKIDTYKLPKKHESKQQPFIPGLIDTSLTGLTIAFILLIA
jgi:hypothetical protein